MESMELHLAATERRDSGDQMVSFVRRLSLRFSSRRRRRKLTNNPSGSSQEARSDSGGDAISPIVTEDRTFGGTDTKADFDLLDESRKDTETFIRKLSRRFSLTRRGQKSRTSMRRGEAGRERNRKGDQREGTAAFSRAAAAGSADSLQSMTSSGSVDSMDKAAARAGYNVNGSRGNRGSRAAAGSGAAPPAGELVDSQFSSRGSEDSFTTAIMDSPEQASRADEAQGCARRGDVEEGRRPRGNHAPFMCRSLSQLSTDSAIFAAMSCRCVGEGQGDPRRPAESCPLKDGCGSGHGVAHRHSTPVGLHRDSSSDSIKSDNAQGEPAFTRLSRIAMNSRERVQFFLGLDEADAAPGVDCLDGHRPSTASDNTASDAEDIAPVTSCGEDAASICRPVSGRRRYGVTQRDGFTDLPAVTDSTNTNTNTDSVGAPVRPVSSGSRRISPGSGRSSVTGSKLCDSEQWVIKEEEEGGEDRRSPGTDSITRGVHSSRPQLCRQQGLESNGSCEKPESLDGSTDAVVKTTGSGSALTKRDSFERLGLLRRKCQGHKGNKHDKHDKRDSSGSTGSFQRNSGKFQDSPPQKAAKPEPIRKISRRETHEQVMELLRQHSIQEEYTYRQVLSCILNPLGAADMRPGFKPKDLASYVREVFEVDKETHIRVVKTLESRRNRPPNIVLLLKVIEAQDLKTTGNDGLNDTYAFFQLVSPKSPLVSPRNSPRTSPRTSPKVRRKRSSIKVNDEFGQQTLAVKAGQDPKWHEDFEIEVRDLQHDELHVMILTDGGKSDQERIGIHSLEKERHFPFSLLKSRHLKFNETDGVLGQFRIPLRDIPATGCDKWFNLFQDKKLKNKTQGQCRLRLQLSYVSFDEVDDPESDQLSVETYHRVVQQFYNHAIRQMALAFRHPSAQESPRFLFPGLPSQDKAVLDQLAAQHNFPNVSQKLMDLVVILELMTDTTSLPENCLLSEKLLKDAIDSLQDEYSLEQGEDCDSTEERSRRGITDSELALLDKAATTYIKHRLLMVKAYPEGLDTLFPPQVLNVDSLDKKIGTVSSLLLLRIWTCNEDIRREVVTLITNKLQNDARMWIDRRLANVKSADAHPVIAETKIMVGVLQESSQVMTPIHSVMQHFSRMGVDYFRVAALAMENKLTAKAKELTMKMDEYQLSYLHYHVNIQESSIISLKLYFSLANFYNTSKVHFLGRDMWLISMAGYQSWFKNSVLFWLQTFREEAIRRIERALEIEKDPVEVTSLVKYSNSCVDVVSSFSKIIAEWRQIDFADADIATLGVTKITDTICDGAKQYVAKVSDILENNGYYDFIVNQQFDVTDQLCITLNNIVHVSKYLNDLPTLLDWAGVSGGLSSKHESAAVGQTALDTLCRLRESTKEDIWVQAKKILKRITDLIALDLEKYTANFTQCQPDVPSSVDPLLGYLKTNLAVFHDKLDPNIVPYILKELWTIASELFEKTLMPGQRPSYYEQMFLHLQSLRAYFQRVGLDPRITDSDQYYKVVDTLQINAQTSESLMLAYYKDLLIKTPSPNDYYGHLIVKIGYDVDPTSDFVTIHIRILRAKQLPSVKHSGTCDPYITLTLCPSTVYPISRSLKTAVVKNNKDPVFNLKFQFQRIPKSLLERDGAVLAFTLWHRDSFTPDRFLGEVLIPLRELVVLNRRQTLEDLPAVSVPLRRPPVTFGPHFKVLQDRKKWDQSARDFLDERNKMLGLTAAYKLCKPMTMLVSKVTGRNTEVTGQPVYESPRM